MLHLSDHVAPPLPALEPRVEGAALRTFRAVIGRLATKPVSIGQRPPAGSNAETQSAQSDHKTAEDDVRHQLDLVETDLARNWAEIRFCETIERRYDAERMDGFTRHCVRSCLIGLFIFDAFLLADIWMVPDIIYQALFAHSVIATPLALIFIFMISTKRFLPAPLVFLFMSLGMAVIVFVILASHSPRAWLYIFTVPLVILFSNIVIPMPVGYAAILSVVASVFVAVVVWIEPQLDAINGAFVLLVVVSTAIFTLIATYRIETGDRRAYLWTLRERLRSEILTHRNAELRKLSDLDGLTQLGNRRHFDETIEALWNAALAAKSSVTLLMIDIDHFKRLNDVHGHPGGDECLRVVAKLLAHETRRSSNMAFRYGGEEFSVLLEDPADGEHAAEIADRLRDKIQRTPIKMEPNLADEVHITASIGHATLFPQPGGSPAQVIAAADQALYVAKKNGRNRVYPAVAA